MQLDCITKLDPDQFKTDLVSQIINVSSKKNAFKDWCSKKLKRLRSLADKSIFLSFYYKMLFLAFILIVLDLGILIQEDVATSVIACVFEKDCGLIPVVSIILFIGAVFLAVVDLRDIFSSMYLNIYERDHRDFVALQLRPAPTLASAGWVVTSHDGSRYVAFDPNLNAQISAIGSNGGVPSPAISVLSKSYELSKACKSVAPVIIRNSSPLVINERKVQLASDLSGMDGPVMLAKTNYFQNLVTNEFFKKRVFDEHKSTDAKARAVFSRRTPALKSVGQLHSFEERNAANQIGISTLLFTADGFLS